jgi:hypothetical protein
MKKRTKIAVGLIDILFLFASFGISIALKPGASNRYFINYSIGFLGFLLLWISISSINNKFKIDIYKSLSNLYWNILKTNLFILGLTVVLMYLLRDLHYSRFIVFGTIVIATFFEIIFSYFHYYLKHAKTANGDTGIKPTQYEKIIRPFLDEKEASPVTLDEKIIKESKKVDEAIIKETGKDVYKFISTHIDISEGDYIIFSTTTQFNVEKLPVHYYNNIINLKRINDIRYVNKFMEAVNSKIPVGGKFIGCVETKNQRKKRLLNKYPVILNYFYYILDFIVKRVFPKFSLTKKIYFFLTKGNNRVISKAETIGRLYSCGFELSGEANIDGYLYFTGKKVKEPVFDENPTYGPFVKLSRIGKHGKNIYVYKLRTMHPFAEYIQNYVYEKNNLREGGKFQNDFRITTLGKLFRKFWIDEIPMLINLFKGEMKLVGIRPLSRHYFSLYSSDLQKRRINYKPGLIPPFYYDLPQTLEEIQNSELKYLDAYDKSPLLTDWKYFWCAFWNIVFRNKRSA